MARAALEADLGSSLLLFDGSHPKLGCRAPRLSASRILVVDDAPHIRRVLRTILVAAGYKVRGAGSGERALDAIRAQHFDMVLIDMNMPGMGGLDTCRLIR